MAEYYRSSGIVPLGGASQTLLAGLVVGIPLGVGYSYAVVHIPFAYINVLLTLGLGAAVGAVVSKAARRGRIRNALVPPAIGFLCGLITFYVAWGADALARFGWPENGDPTVFFDPRFLWSYLQVFYARGFWGLGRDENISGIPLAIVWLAEGGMIVGCAVALPWSELTNLVFCEACDRWTSSESNLVRLASSEADNIAARVEQGDVSVLRDAPRAGFSDADFLTVGVRWCETCTDSNYLEIERVTVTIDKNGKEKVKTTPLVDKLVISAMDVATLRVMGQEAASRVEDVPDAPTAVEPQMNADTADGRG